MPRCSGPALIFAAIAINAFRAALVRSDRDRGRRRPDDGGGVIGVLAIRTRGIYFAMVTMALAQCVYYLFYQAVELDRAGNGKKRACAGINVRVIDIFGLKLDFIHPADTILCDCRLRDRGLLRPVAHSRFTVWRRGSKRRVRTRRAQKASGYDVALVRQLTFILSGGFLRAGRRAGGPAPLHRAD